MVLGLPLSRQSVVLVIVALSLALAVALAVLSWLESAA